MMNQRSIRMACIALVAVVLLSSCTGSKRMAVNQNIPLSDEYVPSRIPKSELLQQLNENNLSSVQGRARVQFSSPGVSERGIAEFKADKNNMQVSIRNNLGIEGGNVLVDSDSVLLYYNLDRVAWKFSIEDYEAMPDISMKLPLNLLAVIRPMVDEDDIASVHENANSYLLTLDDGSELIIDRQTRLPNLVRYNTDIPDRFSEFTYESYSRLNGITLPRRILAVTKDRNNRIRLDVTELQVNPTNLRFSLNIPNGVPIFR
jgi:outer membrane biogenesis lipoprotein LolB